MKIGGRDGVQITKSAPRSFTVLGAVWASPFDFIIGMVFFAALMAWSWYFPQICAWLADHWAANNLWG